MVELRWDEIGEEYRVLKDRVIGWANTKAEQKGEAVPMEVDGLDEGGGEVWDEDWGDDGGGTIGAVYPNTRCYFCQGFGHMARECPQKGKGKGKDGGRGGKGKGGGLKRREAEKAEREDSRRRVREKEWDGKADTTRRAAEKAAMGKDIRGRATAVGRWDTRRRNVGGKALTT